MIKIADAFRWLNRFEPSNLGELARPKIESLSQKARDDSISDSQFENELDQVVQQMTTPMMNLELAEFLLQCSAFALRRGLAEKARTWTASAASAYPDGSHRKAVVRWMAGIALWQQSNTLAAHREWIAARAIFQEIAQAHYQLLDYLPKKTFVRLSYSHRGMPPGVKWYMDRLSEMEADLYCTIEETQTWLKLPFLGHHENGEISASMRPMAENVRKKVEEGGYLNASQMLNDLKQIGSHSWDYLDEPKIMVLSALIYYRLGDRYSAARLLRQATGAFPPHEHLHAVASWMLGAILWQIPAERHQVQHYWDESIACFQDLKLRADHQNEKERFKWYRLTLPLMERALKQQIQDNF